jgi:ribosome biogenesis GTPase
MDTRTTITLEALGYTNFFEIERKKHGLVDYPVARVLAEYRGAYKVMSPNGQFIAKITGKLLYAASNREDYPAVGDWVSISELGQGQAVIRDILPRVSLLQKKQSSVQERQIIAANIDTAFIVASMDRDFNLNRFERFFVLCTEGRIHPVIVLNKIDLLSHEEVESRIAQIHERFRDVDVISTSTVAAPGIQELELGITPGKTYCFLGSSGVGKSSLINALLGKDEIKTREISLSLERGTHTTTTREMYFLKSGGLVIDNPGTREVGIVASEAGIETVFEQINRLAQNCRFSDCSHRSEPGCAVQKAVKEKVLDTHVYDNYIKLKKESDFYQLTELEKREKDRKFGKYIKSVLKELR